MQDWPEDRPQGPAPAGFCDGCGGPLLEGERFCTSCGRPLREYCSWCGSDLPAGTRVCPSCGRPAVRERARIYQRKAIAGKPIAGFGFRTGVYLVDSIIMSTISSILNRFVVRETAEQTEAIERLSEGEPTTFAEFLDLFEPLIWWIIGFLLVGLALQVMWNSIGWSPAKRIIGLRIVDAAGNAPGWRRGLGRTAASLLSGLVLGLGYLASAWNAEKRTWHDRMAGTWVVDVRKER